MGADAWSPSPPRVVANHWLGTCCGAQGAGGGWMLVCMNMCVVALVPVLVGVGGCGCGCG